MAAKRTRGWHRLMSGMYVYTNEAGKTLAHINRNRSFWDIIIFPMADGARELRLSASPKTLAEAKVIAETTYKYQTVKALKEEQAELARLKSLGCL